MIDSQGPRRRGADRVPQLHDHRRPVGDRGRGGAGRRRTGPRLELPRDLLPKPGHWRRSVRGRRIPHRGRQGGRRRGHRALEPRTQERAPARRGRTHDRGSRTARLHRHAVIRRRRPERQARTAGNPGLGRRNRRSDRLSGLDAGAGSGLGRGFADEPSGLHNHHYRALNPRKGSPRLATPGRAGRSAPAPGGRSSAFRGASADGEAPGCAWAMRARSAPGRIRKRSGGSRVRASPSTPIGTGCVGLDLELAHLQLAPGRRSSRPPAPGGSTSTTPSTASSSRGRDPEPIARPSR